MILYQYQGKKHQNLASHGKVKKGGKLRLTEEEGYSLRDNSDWKALPDDLTGFPEDPPHPVAGRYYDLAALPWKEKAIFRKVRRLRRTALLNAMKQLEAMGFPLPLSLSRFRCEEAREAILQVGRMAGWV